MSLKGKVAIVTGASRGIGAATAARLAASGAAVVVNYLGNAARAAEVVHDVEASGGRAVAVQADVRDPASVRSMVARAEEQLGRVDILVNNAHQAYQARPFEETTWEEFQRELDTLVRGCFNTTQAVLPPMKRQGAGVILNIGSTMAHHPLVKHAFYITAKSALLGLTKALALELGPHGIRVNLVTPGPVDTDHNAGLPKELMERLARETPLYGRIGRPADIARAIALMAEDDAAFVTGANLMVCAGFTIV